MFKRTQTSIIPLLILVLAFSSWGVLQVAASHQVATLEIPSIQVSAPVVSVPFSTAAGTWDVAHLRWNVGHLSGTANVGQPGNVAFGAHSLAMDGSVDVFYHLNSVNVGDSVFVTTNGVRGEYRVVETKNVDMYDLSILNPTGPDRLTIFTCDPLSFDGTDYQRRDVVVAVPVG
jgi:LPXTG-site transpeptidase (sortase) family protein